MGFDLPLFEFPGEYKRIVACLNIWNDAAELAHNLETWLPHVDHVIAVDGAYRGTFVDIPESTDGTLDILRNIPNCTLIEAEDWPDQPTKKTKFFEHTRAGDLLLLVDADEHFENVACLRDSPYLDVGWIRYTSPIYAREQSIPRVIRWRPGLDFQCRHHWIFDHSGLVKTNQRGGQGLIHRRLDIKFHNSRGEHRDPVRNYLAYSYRGTTQVSTEEKQPLRTTGHEPLHILQLGPFDPGCVIFRLHTAINTTTPHTFVMATGLQEHFMEPRQFDIIDDFDTVQGFKADIYHHHVTMLGDHPPRPTVMHHHGTVYRSEPDVWNERDNGLRLVSNLELLQYGDNLNYLPNPIPVAEYRKMSNIPEWQKNTLRIAHSPSKREKKGTDAFINAVDTCRKLGLDVSLHLVERTTVKASIEVKSTCHACFDSFWLGMQCSGLEAGAMGIPVIAGDHDVRREMLNLYGQVPYTFADNEQELTQAIERLATDEAYYRSEADKVSAHVLNYHDPATVAALYLDLLDAAFDWRNKLEMGSTRRLCA